MDEIQPDHTNHGAVKCLACGRRTKQFVNGVAWCLQFRKIVMLPNPHHCSAFKQRGRGPLPAPPSLSDIEAGGV